MVETVTDQSANLPALPESTALDPSAIESRQASEAQAIEQTPPPPAGDEDGASRLPRAVQKRIDEVISQKKATEQRAQAEIQHWQRIAYEEAQKAEAAAKQRQQMEIDTSQPTLESCGGDLEKYIAATTEWASKKQALALKAQLEEQQRQMRGETDQQRQAEMQRAQQAQAFAAEQRFVMGKIEEGKKQYPDFDKAIMNPDLPKFRDVNPAAYQAILSSERGIDVAYYIAKNPMLAHEIALSPPMQAVMKIGQIEGMFRAGHKVTQAPPPPTQVASVGSGDATTLNDKMSMEEWVARRQKQKRANG